MHAYSKVGASGVWQFMPSTARRFMRIDDAVDERLDPIVSTRAAARFLRENYDRLGTWPLAITAYNHGPAGIARAVRETGTTDIGTIVEKYRGPSFKFASRNFYAEFLAALDVERNYRKYFGTLPLFPPLKHDEVPLPHYVPIASVVRCAGGDEDAFRELNPGLLPAVYTGRQRVPRDYTVRLPAGSTARFQQCYSTLPASHKATSQQKAFVVHRVRRGQTLAQIARLYGTSVKEIQRRNGLRGKPQAPRRPAADDSQRLRLRIGDCGLRIGRFGNPQSAIRNPQFLRGHLLELGAQDGALEAAGLIGRAANDLRVDAGVAEDALPVAALVVAEYDQVRVDAAHRTDEVVGNAEECHVDVAQRGDELAAFLLAVLGRRCP